jgi:hypothetical protein
VLSGKTLSMQLRTACDGVKRRVWIASPYVGNWRAIRTLLGRSWWDKSDIDVRLLTDTEEGSLNGDTLKRLAQKGPIHHLRGLHAKLYIVDDNVLLTSANLTCTAFTKRYEAGVLLTGAAAQSAITLYVKWWEPPLSRPVESSELSRIWRRRGSQPGEDTGKKLPTLFLLPGDPGDFGDHKYTDIFLDYPHFLRCYATLAKEYTAVQRIWPTVPRNFEVDGFLDYLFHWHRGCPSRAYETLAPRQLSASSRRSEIKKLAAAFRSWASAGADDGQWRKDRSAFVRQVLSPKRIGRLTRKNIRGVAGRLNCMHDSRMRDRFLDYPTNTTAAVRVAWKELLYGTAPLTERMSLCAGRLFGFKRSCVQELLGFFEPDRYPLRNANVNAGLRFFGFDVRAH